MTDMTLDEETIDFSTAPLEGATNGRTPTLETEPDAPPPAIDYQEFESDEALREHILAVEDITEEVVPVPEWQTKVLCKAITGTQRALLIKSYVNQKTGEVKLEQMFPRLLVLGCFNPKTGKRIFRDADIQQLMDKHNGGILDGLALKVARLSRLDDQSVLQAKKN